MSSTTETHDGGCRTALTERIPQLCVAVLLERIDVLANGPRKAAKQPVCECSEQYSRI